jgi:hypothetical protein
MALGIGNFIHLIRTIDRLVGLERKHGDLIEALDKQVRTLASRLDRLEAREDLLIVEAKAAAATAASVASTGHLADLARQVGILEERTRVVDGVAVRSISEKPINTADHDRSAPDNFLHKS